jgi:peroxiredoxin
MRKNNCSVLIVAALVVSLNAAAAPQFTLMSSKGDSVTLASFKGKVVVLDFWATWCSTCRESIPHLNGLYTKFKSQGVEVLGINVEKVNRSKIDRFIKKASLRYPVLLDPSMKTASMYDVKGLPSVVIIDRNQQQVRFFRGMDKKILTEIDSIIGEMVRRDTLVRDSVQ